MPSSKRGLSSSGSGAKVTTPVEDQAWNEKHYGEVDVILLRIESARQRAEQAAADLRAAGAEDFLIEALERAQEELSETAKRLTQGTFFAVPSAQLTL